jgi:hypothetical protein
VLDPADHTFTISNQAHKLDCYRFVLWVFKYRLKSVEPPEIEGAELLIGDGDVIHPADLAVYKL